jgi:hypothetical protein
LVERLKKENIVDKSLYVETKKFPGICYTKSERAIKAASIDFDKIVVVVDADGPANREGVFKGVDVHIAKEIKSKVEVIILDYELEEWICYSFGIPFGEDKPSKVLNERCKEKRGAKSGYRKWQLPRFVENLDINALRRNCRSFEEVVSMLLAGK